MKETVEKMLQKISGKNTSEKNLKIIKKFIPDVNYTFSDNGSILHFLCDDLYEEEKVFITISCLLDCGVDPNRKCDYGYNFIQCAIYNGYSENFILNITQEALKFKLNVNHVDDDKDTMMHTLIYADDYHGGLIKFYKLLCDNGFDTRLTDSNGDNLYEAILSCDDEYTKEQVSEFGNIFLEMLEKYSNSKGEKQNEFVIASTAKRINEKADQEPENKIVISKSDKDFLLNYGTILNDKTYLSSPAVGRDNEIKNLFITLAQEKKTPIIVGESGVGKSALVDELAYRIQKNEVPDFLKNKLIYELNPFDTNAGTEFSGTFEQRIKDLMIIIKKYNMLLYIDEIHSIYGIGKTKGNDNDLSSMLKLHISRDNIKIIGTTTDKEYDKYFSNDALKRRFEVIKVKEPDKDMLYIIVKKVLKDYSLKKSIVFENNSIKEEIIKILINSTEKNNRVYNDKLNNPDLVISIIDKAFAVATCYNSKYIKKNHFMEAYDFIDRIYSFSKEVAIKELSVIESNKIKKQSKVLTFNPKNRG